MIRTEKKFNGVGYIEYRPANWNGHVIVFLHGTGERGSDLSLIEKIALPKQANSGVLDSKGYLILAFQCPLSASSWNKGLITTVIEVTKGYTAKGYHITGLSMGGIGAFSALKYFPGFFQTAGVVCGKTSATSTIEALLLTKIKAWHGVNDTVVTIGNVRSVLAAVTKLGGDMTLIEYPGVGHNAWDRAYSLTDPESYWTFIDSYVKHATESPMIEIKGLYMKDSDFMIETDQGTYKIAATKI
jgi:predicted peptidase